MSMFVVTTDTMQRVVRGFKKLHDTSPVYWAVKIRSIIPEAVETREIKPGLPHDYEVDWSKLGVELFALNIRSAVERYGENHGMDNGTELQFIFKEPFNSPLIWSLKQMQSLRYQCSEGVVTEEPLYMLLENAIGSLAEKICRNLPEYETAPW